MALITFLNNCCQEAVTNQGYAELGIGCLASGAPYQLVCAKCRDQLPDIEWRIIAALKIYGHDQAL